MSRIEFYSVSGYVHSIEIDGRDTGFYFSHRCAGEAKCYEAKPHGRILKLDKNTYPRYKFFDGSSGLEDELIRKFAELDKWT